MAKVSLLCTGSQPLGCDPNLHRLIKLFWVACFFVNISRVIKSKIEEVIGNF